MGTQIKTVFQINLPYLLAQIIRVFSDKPGLSERNPLYLEIMWFFFRRNLLYLRETHIICLDNVSLSEKKTHCILEKPT